MVLSEIDNPSDIKPDAAFPAFMADGLVKNLGPQSKLFSNLSLYKPTEKPPIFIAFSWIDPIPSPTVRGPGTPALLEP